MLKNYIKQHADKVLSPILYFLKSLSVSPNLLTLFSLVFAFLGFFFYPLVFFTLAFFLDYLDGYLARNTKTTKFGAFIDGISDRVVEIVVILYFHVKLFPVYGFFSSLVLINLLAFGAFFVSYLKAYAISKGIVKNEKLLFTLFGREERSLLYILALYFLNSSPWISLILLSISLIFSFLSFFLLLFSIVKKSV